jgi:hypothetical protein
MDSEIKGVIVDKDYLEQLQEENKKLKECFGYETKITIGYHMHHIRTYFYSKQEFSSLINKEVLDEIIGLLNRRNKKKATKILKKYKIQS